MKIKNRFADRWFLLTGAGGGLGSAFARRLLCNETSRVILTDCNRNSLVDLRQRLIDLGVEEERFRIVPCDLGDDAEREQLCQTVEELPLFGIINNAGLTSYAPMSIDRFSLYESIFRINVLTPLHLILRLGDTLIRQAEGGCRPVILNIISMAALMPVPYQAVYAAAYCADAFFSEMIRWYST